MDLLEKLDSLSNRKAKYSELSKRLACAREEGETQISTVNPDSRALAKKMNIVEVAYNVCELRAN